jgi:3-phenylpropionate/trans-cinnamate dioxygenase ferredoxin reductase subunit
MPTLKVDRGLCEGYGNCVFQAADVFDLGDDDIVTLLRSDVPPSDRTRIEEAVQSCPVAALSIVDE